MSVLITLGKFGFDIFYWKLPNINIKVLTIHQDCLSNFSMKNNHFSMNKYHFLRKTTVFQWKRGSFKRKTTIFQWKSLGILYIYCSFSFSLLFVFGLSNFWNIWNNLIWYFECLQYLGNFGFANRENLIKKAEKICLV